MIMIKTVMSQKGFYSFVQNKLHYAVTGHTAAEIIMDRSDSSKPTMGLTTWKDAPDGKILKRDVLVAKNYLNELLMNCRMNGYFELNELDKIILETNGKFTFYPKTSSRPLKLGDLHQEVQKEFIPTILILQGTIIYENLELINHNQKWLEQIMKVHGINLQEIVILYVDGQQTIHFYLKNELKRDFI